jgi:hypothetical protein
MSTPRLNKGYVVLGAVALSFLACGGTAMPEIKSPFASEEPRMTLAQQEEMRAAQQDLAKAKVASEDARLFKQSVTEERAALDQGGRPGAAGAKASGPRPIVVTEETVRVTETAPPPGKPPKPRVSAGRGTAAADLRELEKPEGMQASRTKRSVEMREGDAVVVERRVTVQSQAAGGKGSSLTREQRVTRADEAWSAKNRFADEQFRLRQAQEAAAEAKIAATEASIRREHTNGLNWEGRAASAKRLKAAEAESKAQSQVMYQEQRVSTAKSEAEQSYIEWREANPRPRAP